MTGCPDSHARSLLEWYVDGEVDARDRAHVAVHLVTCGECEREVRTFVVLKQALRRQHVADPDAVARLCSFAALLTRGCR